MNVEAWESPKVGCEPGPGATRRQEGKGALGSEREGQGGYQKSLAASGSCTASSESHPAPLRRGTWCAPRIPLKRCSSE